MCCQLSWHVGDLKCLSRHKHSLTSSYLAVWHAEQTQQHGLGCEIRITLSKEILAFRHYDDKYEMSKFKNKQINDGLEFRGYIGIGLLSTSDCFLVEWQVWKLILTQLVSTLPQITFERCISCSGLLFLLSVLSMFNSKEIWLFHGFTCCFDFSTKSSSLQRCFFKTRRRHQM